MKNFIVLALMTLSLSAFAKNDQLIARQDLNLSLDQSSKRLSSLFSSVNCTIKRIGNETLVIQRGDSAKMSVLSVDRVFSGTRTLTTGTWGGGQVSQKVDDKMAGVYTFTLDFENNKKAELICVGKKTKIEYMSTDSNVNYSGLPIVHRTNDFQELTYEEVQSAIDNFFELQ